MKGTFGSSWFELSFIVGVFIFLLGYGYYLRGLDRPFEIGLAFAIIFILLVLLQKKLEFNDFYSAFNNLYASDFTSKLPDEQFQFVDELNEQLFFVDKNPSDVERKEHNYLDDGQFRDWLEKLKQRNEALWKS